LQEDPRLERWAGRSGHARAGKSIRHIEPDDRPAFPALAERYQINYIDIIAIISAEGTSPMPAVTIRNLPEETHRALRIRAAHHGRSTEAEIRAILEAAVRPDDRVKLGALLGSIAREAGGLSDEEAERFNQLRDRSPTEPISFE
jgi:plasmid stability protein